MIGDNSAMSDLPPYSVRISARARRLHMKVVPPGRIEVVVPKRFDPGHVPAFVDQHRDWLDHHLAQMTATYAGQPLLPETIHFQAIAESWQVSYVDAVRARVVVHADAVRVYGQTEQQMCEALQQWLQQRAKQVLPPWLEYISQEIGLGFSRVSVRGQKTRWGSCSVRRNINLNRALLFVSPAAVRYLMTHELCHTVHMNHSPRYWALVEKMMPDYADCEAELRRAMRTIPVWALPGFGG